MSRVLKLGIITASLQLVIVTLVTCFVSISSLRELVIPAMKETTPDAELLYVYSPLKWLLFFVAVGIALTDTRFAALAAVRIRHVSRLMKPTDPDHAAENLLGLVGLTTVGLVVLTLEQPPEFIVALSSYFRYASTIWIMWSGFISIGVASFGAISYAAWRAVHGIE